MTLIFKKAIPEPSLQSVFKSTFPSVPEQHFQYLEELLQAQSMAILGSQMQGVSAWKREQQLRVWAQGISGEYSQNLGFLCWDISSAPHFVTAFPNSSESSIKHEK